MAVKTAQYIFNGQTINLTYNSTSGKWEATVTAPSKSSYSQTDHVLGGTVKATDVAGNTTTVDQSHATLGSSLKIRVKEKVAPVISITAPTADSYITTDHQVYGNRCRFWCKFRYNRNEAGWYSRYSYKDSNHRWI